VLLDEATLNARLAALTPPSAGNGNRRGYERLFHETVLQADQGADFDFLVSPTRTASPGEPI
jgi:hypothetical protein